MALIEKLGAIADAIREKTGKEEGLTLDAMPSEIEGIKTGVELKAIAERSITEIEDDTAETVGAYAFRGCNNLTKAHFTNATTVSDSAFADCASLSDLYFPKLTKSIGTGNDYGAFRGCKSITEVTDKQFPELKFLTFGMFRDCTSLTKVSLSNVTHLEWYGLVGCSAVETLELPNLKHIGMNGFHGCGNKLKKVVFPKLIEITNYGGEFRYIDYLDCANTSNEVFKIGGTGIFTQYCTLTVFIIRSGSVAELGGAVLGKTNIANGTGYIYVPRALIEDYKVATNWATYASQFRALEDYTVDGTITGELDESKI